MNALISNALLYAPQGTLFPASFFGNAVPSDAHHWRVSIALTEAWSRQLELTTGYSPPVIVGLTKVPAREEGAWMWMKINDTEHQAKQELRNTTTP